MQLSEVDKAKLLNELRISGAERDAPSPGAARWLGYAAGGVVLVATLAVGAWWLIGLQPLPVKTAAAVAPGAAGAGVAGGAGGAVLQATGYVTARRRATVSTQITGTLVQVLIEEGVRVKQGQIIARLDDSALRAGLGAAQANLRANEAQVAQARAQLAQAEADARRQAELAASGMLSRQAAEQARTLATTYAAQLEARSREGDAARAQVAQAKVNFDYAVVRAPFAGIVTEKAAQVGEIVSPLSAGGGFTRTGVGTIVDMDSLEVDVDVNEASIGRILPLMPAQVVLDAYPDWKIAAHVVTIIPAADRGKATIKVRVAMEQKDARLVPDMSARVTFLNAQPVAGAAAAPLPVGVLVPPEAVVQREGQAVVFVMIDGKAAQRVVAPAAKPIGALTLLPAGVQAGERIVLAPPGTLRDGARIEEMTR